MPKSGDGLTAHPALSFWQRRERVLSKAADEKRKLTANYLNGLGVAAAAVGVLSPAITYLSTTATTPTYQIATIAVVCLLLSVALHFSARQALEGMVNEHLAIPDSAACTRRPPDHRPWRFAIRPLGTSSRARAV